MPFLTHEEWTQDSENIVNSLVVQWLGLHTFIARGTGSISGQGTKVPHAAGCS